jgi:hypothetical protein
MWVVLALDELEDSHSAFGLSSESCAVDEFAFEDREEAFTHRVVVGVTDRAHRGAHTGLPTATTEGNPGVLTALIGMMDHIIGSPLPQRYVQCLEHQFGTQMIGHRPADHPPAPHIQHDCQIEIAKH